MAPPPITTTSAFTGGRPRRLRVRDPSLSDGSRTQSRRSASSAGLPAGLAGPARSADAGEGRAATAEATAAASSRVAARGSAAPDTAPMTATPNAPAASTSGTRSAVIPAMATTGASTAATTAASPARPSGSGRPSFEVVA